MQAEFLVTLRRDLAHDFEVGHGSGSRLVRACVEATEVTGAGIMLMSDGEHRGTLGTSDAAIAVVEELQFTLGEGPCIDTFATGAPVLEPHLRDPAVVRWHEFTGPALAAGVEAVYGFPLIVSGVCLGALDLYMDRPWSLSDDQFVDAVAMAEIVAQTVLALQAQAEPGAIASELERGTLLRAVVHQAAGMLAVQLDVTVSESLARLRAYSYGESRPINEVARAIVEGELTLE